MLKRLWNIVTFCLLLVVVASSCSKSAPSVATTLPAQQSAGDNLGDSIVDVATFVRTQPMPGQSASIEGVVATVDAQQQLLTLIDKGEYRECAITTCAAFYLPVRWTGTMPAKEDAVVVQGEVAKEGDKLIYVANEIRARSSTSETAKP